MGFVHLFALSLLMQSEARRVLGHTGAGSKVCKIKEVSDQGSPLYHIHFSLDVGSCSTIRNCLWFNMRNLAQNFIEKPVRTPPTGSIGKCECKLKSLQAGESGALQTLPGAGGGKKLLDFIATSSEPCEEHQCWLKYNQFVYLTRSSSEGGSNYRNVSRSANHWDFTCEEGVATLDGLKTVNELHAAAAKEEQAELIKQAAQANILPEAADSMDEDLSSGDQTLPAKFTIEDKGGSMQKADLSESIPHTANTPQGEKKVNDPTSHKSDHSLSTDDFPTLKDISTKKVTIGNLDDQSSNPTKVAPNAASTVPMATIQRLQASVDLMMLIERKMSTMLVHAEDFARLAQRMQDGEAEQAQWSYIDEGQPCEKIQLDMEALVNALNHNVDNLLAFSAATEITNARSEAVEAFLIGSRAAMDLQFRIVSSLNGLIENAVACFADFNIQDGRSAFVPANHIMEQLGILKVAVSECRRGLASAMAQIVDA